MKDRSFKERRATIQHDARNHVTTMRAIRSQWKDRSGGDRRSFIPGQRLVYTSPALERGPAARPDGGSKPKAATPIAAACDHRWAARPGGGIGCSISTCGAVWGPTQPDYYRTTILVKGKP